MNLPGKIHVMDLSVDSRLEIVETWATRKDSYWAKTDDMRSKDRRKGTGSTSEEVESVADPRWRLRG